MNRGRHREWSWSAMLKQILPYLQIKYHDKIVVLRYDHDEVCDNANFFKDKRLLLIFMYSSELKGLYVLLSRTQARPGRAVKQEKEKNSRNHVQAF